MVDVDRASAPQSVSITLNTDEAGRRELAMDFGGAAVVLGPDLVNVLESVLTGEDTPQAQLREAVKAIDTIDV